MSVRLAPAAPWVAALAAVGALLAPNSAQADDERRLGGRVVARQPRPHRLVHEVNLGVGILPLDALYTGISFGGSYTLHLNDFFGLELVDFRYSANIDSGLRNRLAELEVAPTITPEVEYLAGTGILFTPFFGKLALNDDAIVETSTHFGLSGGLARFTDGFRFQVSGGPGFRFFFSDQVSARLDVRGTVAFDEVLPTETLLQINLAFAFNLGSKARVAPTRAEAQPDPEEVLDALFPESKPPPRGPDDTPRRTEAP